MFTAEYTVDLDNLLEMAIIEAAGLGRLVDGRIILMDIELAMGGGCSPIVPQWNPLLALRVTIMDNISFIGQQHIELVPFVALTLITGSITMP